MNPKINDQLLVQLVLATKNETVLSDKEFREEVWKEIYRIVTDRGHKCIIINGNENHVHILIELRPFMSLSDLANEIKQSSSIFINKGKMTDDRFEWQEGFGAFSHSQSQLGMIYAYIDNQEEYHKNKTFREEYINFLRSLNIDIDDSHIINRM